MGRPRIPKDSLYDLWNQGDYYERHQTPGPGDCITWHGGMHVQGYGMVGAWRKPEGTKIMTTTHRIAARRKFQRALASSEYVIHTCDNPACVNEDHLVLGDRYTVHQVMASRGRHRPGGRTQPPKP